MNMAMSGKATPVLFRIRDQRYLAAFESCKYANLGREKTGPDLIPLISGCDEGNARLKVQYAATPKRTKNTPIIQAWSLLSKSMLYRNGFLIADVIFAVSLD
jgi:hypothetical protein